MAIVRKETPVVSIIARKQRVNDCDAFHATRIIITEMF